MCQGLVQTMCLSHSLPGKVRAHSQEQFPQCHPVIPTLLKRLRRFNCRALAWGERHRFCSKGVQSKEKPPSLWCLTEVVILAAELYSKLLATYCPFFKPVSPVCTISTAVYVFSPKKSLIKEIRILRELGVYTLLLRVSYPLSHSCFSARIQDIWGLILRSL